MADLRRRVTLVLVATSGLFLMDLASNAYVVGDLPRAVLGAALTAAGWLGTSLWGLSGQADPPPGPRRRP